MSSSISLCHLDLGLEMCEKCNKKNSLCRKCINKIEVSINRSFNGFEDMVTYAIKRFFKFVNMYRSDMPDSYIASYFESRAYREEESASFRNFKTLQKEDEELLLPEVERELILDESQYRKFRGKMYGGEKQPKLGKKKRSNLISITKQNRDRNRTKPARIEKDALFSEEFFYP